MKSDSKPKEYGGMDGEACSALSVDDCKAIAATRCLDIYMEITPEGIEDFREGHAVRRAWEAGKALKEAWDLWQNVQCHAPTGDTNN